MFEDPAAWCADRAPGQPSPEDALPLDVRQLQNSALPLQVRSCRVNEAILWLCYSSSSHPSSCTHGDSCIHAIAWLRRQWGSAGQTPVCASQDLDWA